MAERVLEFLACIDVTPRGMGRPNFSRQSGRAYTPANSRAYVDLLRSEFERRWSHEPLGGALAVNVQAWFAIPKSAKRGTRIHHTQKPDGDNVAKAVLDALMPEKKSRKKGVPMFQGVIVDDAAIIDLRVRKWWSAEKSLLQVEVFSIQ